MLDGHRRTGEDPMQLLIDIVPAGVSR